MTANVAEVGSEPLFSVVRGAPTDEELAALLIVLTVRTAAGPRAKSAGSTGSGWAAYGRSVGVALPPGPNAWRMSSRRT